ncbi:hypothetical protein D3C84_492230 [compost metagenome]
MQVAGLQAADVLAGQLRAGQRLQPGVHRQHQLAPGLQMAQTQLHQVVAQFPGAVDLAALAVDQVQAPGKILLGLERHGKAHRQRAGAIHLHFGDVHHVQLAAGIACGHRRALAERSGRLAAGHGGVRFDFGGFGGGGITGAEQAQDKCQKQSLVRHCRLQRNGGCRSQSL